MRTAAERRPHHGVAGVAAQQHRHRTRLHHPRDSEIADGDADRPAEKRRVGLKERGVIALAEMQRRPADLPLDAFQVRPLVTCRAIGRRVPDRVEAIGGPLAAHEIVGDADDRGRIQSSAQLGQKRPAFRQAHPHGLAEAVEKMLLIVGVAPIAQHGLRIGTPAVSPPNAPIVPHDYARPGRHVVNADVRRGRAIDRLRHEVTEIRVVHRHAAPGARAVNTADPQEDFQIGRPDDSAADVDRAVCRIRGRGLHAHAAVAERPHAGEIAREQHASFERIPHDQREVANQARERIDAPRDVGREHDVGVARAPIGAVGQLTAQRGAIVEAAIPHDRASARPRGKGAGYRCAGDAAGAGDRHRTVHVAPGLARPASRSQRIHEQRDIAPMGTTGVSRARVEAIETGMRNGRGWNIAEHGRRRRRCRGRRGCRGHRRGRECGGSYRRHDGEGHRSPHHHTRSITRKAVLRSPSMKP